MFHKHGILRTSTEIYQVKEVILKECSINVKLVKASYMLASDWQKNKEFKDKSIKCNSKIALIKYHKNIEKLWFF